MPLSTCCQKTIYEEEAILNHGMCNECMDTGVEASNERQLAKMKKCIVCSKPVDWDMVTEEFDDTFKQADSYGMASLTESQQHVVAGSICSTDCEQTL